MYILFKLTHTLVYTAALLFVYYSSYTPLHFTIQNLHTYIKTLSMTKCLFIKGTTKRWYQTFTHNLRLSLKIHKRFILIIKQTSLTSSHVSPHKDIRSCKKTLVIKHQIFAYLKHAQPPQSTTPSSAKLNLRLANIFNHTLQKFQS